MLVLPADLLADAAHDSATAKQSGWTEVQWPFPIDQFGGGKAFQCGAADCGAPGSLYVRAKIGFCNCTTGVADDDELERIGDLELLGGKVAALGDGRPDRRRLDEGPQPTLCARRRKPVRQIRVVGRLQRPLRRHRRDRGGAARPPRRRRAGVIEFLNGPTVMRWAEVTLGL